VVPAAAEPQASGIVQHLLHHLQEHLHLLLREHVSLHLHLLHRERLLLLAAAAAAS
jgi:hypothetical protein